MNNFNALNHHIASLNHAITSLNKSHQELTMKVNSLQLAAAPAPATAPAITSTVDVKKLVDEAIGEAKSELLNSIESLINSLDVDKKIEEAITKVKSDIDQAIDVDITLPDPPCMDEPIVPLEDDIFVETKVEKTKPAAKKKSTKRQA